jgi:hypothetical protein
VAGPVDQLAEPPAGVGALGVGGQQIELEGQGVGGLAVRGDPAVGGHVLLVEGVTDLGGQLPVRPAVALLAEARRRGGHDVQRADEVGAGDQVGVGPPVGGILGGGSGVEPVTELEAAVPQPVVAGRGHDVVDPGPHARVLVAEQTVIAGGEGYVSGDDGGSVTPGRSGDGERQRVGDDERHGAVVGLLGRQVAEPRGQEPGAVVEEAGRGREDLDVARPAQALVALGAVGGHVEEVAPHAPHDVLVEPVDPLVGAAEPAGALHVRVADLGDHVVGRERLVGGPAVDLGVAEAVEGEAGLPRAAGLVGIIARAGEGQAVGGLGQAEGGGAQLAVLEDLGVAQGDRGAGLGPGEAQAEAADQVLAEVEDRAARGRRHDLGRVEAVGAADRRPHPGDQGSQIALDRTRIGPRFVVETSGIPAFRLAAGVVGLAGVEAAADHGTGSGTP